MHFAYYNVEQQIVLLVFKYGIIFKYLLFQVLMINRVTKGVKKMLEVLEFIFKDIWHFLGTAILLETIFGGIRGFITINNNKKD